MASDSEDDKPLIAFKAKPADAKPAEAKAPAGAATGVAAAPGAAPAMAAAEAGGAGDDDADMEADLKSLKPAEKKDKPAAAAAAADSDADSDDMPLTAFVKKPQPAKSKGADEKKVKAASAGREKDKAKAASAKSKPPPRAAASTPKKKGKAAPAKARPAPARRKSAGASSAADDDEDGLDLSGAGSVVTRYTVLKETEKGELVKKLLCRWWYALEWPSPAELAAAPPPPAGYEALDGYPGLFICVRGDAEIGRLHDARPAATCPSFANFSAKPCRELRDLLETALTRQREELRAHWAKGPGGKLAAKAAEADALISDELKWLKKLKCEREDSAAELALRRKSGALAKTAAALVKAGFQG